MTTKSNVNAKGRNTGKATATKQTKEAPKTTVETPAVPKSKVTPEQTAKTAAIIIKHSPEQPKAMTTPPGNPSDTTTPVKPTREQFLELAKEMNNVLGCEIPVKANTATPVLHAQILNNAENMVSTDFTDGGDGKCFSQTAAKLFIQIGVKLPKAVVKKAEKPEKVEKAAKVKKVKTPKEPKEKAFTWMDATAKAIREVCKKGATLAEIKTAATAIYKEHGNSCEKLPKNVFRYMAQSLVAFAVLELKEGKYSFPVPAK